MRRAKKVYEIRFRATSVDKRRLQELARSLELTESAVLRRLIADAHRAVPTEVPKKT